MVFGCIGLYKIGFDEKVAINVKLFDIKRMIIKSKYKKTERYRLRDGWQWPQPCRPKVGR
jgi:hypothetical protein